MAFFPGLACRPADMNLLIWFFLCPRDSNPGWGDWSRSFCGWGGFCFCFLLVGQVNVSAFACNATGLDAVQRLEQKKASGDKNGADMAHCGTSLSIVNMFGSKYVPWLEKHGFFRDRQHLFSFYFFTDREAVANLVWADDCVLSAIDKADAFLMVPSGIYTGFM